MPGLPMSRPRPSTAVAALGFVGIQLAVVFTADSAMAGSAGPVVAAAPAATAPVATAPIVAGRPASSCCREILDRDPYPPTGAQLARRLADCTSLSCSELRRAADLIHKGKLEEARAALQSASSSDPASPYAHYYLGEIALRLGDPPAAIEALSAAVRLHPMLAGAHALLGHARIAAGAAPQGLIALRTAIALAPGRAQGHLDLGRAYLETGHAEHAVVELERTIEIDPRCLEARYLLARAQMNAGNLEAGCTVLESYVRDARTVPAEGERVARAQEILRTFGPTS